MHSAASAMPAASHATATHAHARDALIEFDAGPHKYTCAGEGGYMSVTTWNHSHFPHFDADAIIKKMNLASPKCKYYGQTPEQIKAGWDQNRDEAAALGTAMHAAIERYLGGLPPHAPPTAENGNTASELSVASANGGLWGVAPKGADAENGNTASELSDASANGGLWGVPPKGADAENGNTASEVNDASANVGCSVALPIQFLRFLADNPNLRCYRTEWMIFDEDVKIAGSIDFVSENADGTLTIYDWKRCKEIKKSNSFGVFALTECIAHLPDTNYWHYALQLNTYKTILERKYEKKVKEMFLVGLHPDLPTYQLLKVPVLEQEMADLFSLRLGGLAPQRSSN